MPSDLVLHKGNSLSFDRLCNDGGRLPFHRLRFFECGVDLIKVISVNLDHMEVKCFKLLVDRIRRVDFLDRTVDLKIVIIYNHNQVVQLMAGCQHGCLPHLAFLDLTISEKCIHSVVCVIHFSCDRHSNCR